MIYMIIHLKKNIETRRLLPKMCYGNDMRNQILLIHIKLK